MSSEANKRLVYDYLQALSGHPKPPELVAEFVSDTLLADHIQRMEEAFPCYELVPELIIAEGDYVAVRGAFHGHQRGLFNGIEPEGKHARASCQVVYRIAEGKIAEHWLQLDVLNLLLQLKPDLVPSL